MGNKDSDDDEEEAKSSGGGQKNSDARKSDFGFVRPQDGDKSLVKVPYGDIVKVLQNK